MRTSALFLTSAVLITAALTACAKQVDVVDGAAAPAIDPTSAAAPAATPTSAAAPATKLTSRTPDTAKSSTPTDAGVTKTSGACPASAATLYKALRNDDDMYERTANPTGLKNPTCTGSYATATTVVQGDIDPAGVLFKYQNGTWRPINLGSGGYCDGYTSAAVAERLGNGC